MPLPRYRALVRRLLEIVVGVELGDPGGAGNPGLLRLGHSHPFLERDRRPFRRAADSLAALLMFDPPESAGERTAAAAEQGAETVQRRLDGHAAMGVRRIWA